jgi:peptide/nickel transport system substrate-binding protein
VTTDRPAGGPTGSVALLVKAMSVAVVALVILAGCSSPDASPGPPSSPPGTSVRGSELSFGLAADADTWAPITTRWTAQQYQVGRALYDPLISYDDSYRPQPYLAESLTPNGDFTEWTLNLRSGVTFHDGSPLDAAAVKAQLEAARRAPGLTGSLTPVTSIDQTGPRSLVVHTSTPWSAFQHVLASQIGFIATAATMSATGSDARPIGTGPFAFDEWAKGDHLHLKRNPTYWQKAPPLDGIDFKVIVDPMARVQGVQSGTLNVAELFESDAQAKVAHLGGENGAIQVLTDNSGETPELVIALQSAKLPFSSSPARQSVAFSIDRDAVVKRIFSGSYPLAEGPYSEGSPWYGQAPWPAWDAGKARKSATDYQKDEGRRLSFELLFPDDPGLAPLGQLLVAQLEAAGVDVTLNVLPTDQIAERTRMGQYDAAVMSSFAGGQPDEDYGLIYGKGISIVPGVESPNLARFRDPIVDEALDKARATNDISKQADQYQKVQEELAREAPYVFLVHLQGSLIAGKNVQGLTHWTLPDGSPGISELRTTVALHQAYLGDPPKS